MTSNRNTSEPKVGEVSPDRFLFDTSHRSNKAVTDSQNTVGNLHNLTLPSVNTFRTINSEDKWLKRYLPDGHNSQIGNMLDKVEVTQWYKIRIPYLQRFYNTETYLVGKQNDYIYALRGKEKEMLCIKILWIPYDLVVLERASEGQPVSETERY